MLMGSNVGFDPSDLTDTINSGSVRKEKLMDLPAFRSWSLPDYHKILRFLAYFLFAYGYKACSLHVLNTSFKTTFS
jgi:hypothetical protein